MKMIREDWEPVANCAVVKVGPRLRAYAYRQLAALDSAAVEEKPLPSAEFYAAVDALMGAVVYDTNRATMLDALAALKAADPRGAGACTHENAKREGKGDCGCGATFATDPKRSADPAGSGDRCPHGSNDPCPVGCHSPSSPSPARDLRKDLIEALRTVGGRVWPPPQSGYDLGQLADLLADTNTSAPEGS